MNLSMHSPALLRAILAGALVLSVASACSRHDRAGAGRDTTESAAIAVTPSDSQDTAQVSSDSSVRATAPDTTSPKMAGTGAATPLDSAGVTSDYALTTDTATSGYSEMARDTSSDAGRGDTAAVAGVKH